MKSVLLACAFLVGLTGITFAQDTVIIAPEQETVIREYVQKKPLASINLPGVELNVGSTVPDNVTLVPVDVPDVSYDYVIVDNRTVLVDRGSRRIVRVLD